MGMKMMMKSPKMVMKMMTKNLKMTVKEMMKKNMKMEMKRTKTAMKILKTLHDVQHDKDVCGKIEKMEEQSMRKSSHGKKEKKMKEEAVRKSSHIKANQNKHLSKGITEILYKRKHNFVTLHEKK